MKRIRDNHGQRRNGRRFGALGEEWMVVLFLFVAAAGLVAEQAVRLGGGAGIV